MLTLSQATEKTRKIIKYTLIVIAAILSVVIIIRGIIALKEIISPTPPPPPTVSFGKLPKLVFPTSINTKKLAYSLDTVSGSLPSFPDRLIVNKMVGYPPDILAVDRANRRVSLVSFPTPGTRLSQTHYRWTDATALQREITMNVETGDFILTSLFLDNPTVIAAEDLGNQESATTTALNFLDNSTMLPSDIDPAQSTTNFFKIDNGALIPASSLSEAQIIGVTLYQANVNELPVYYPKADGSTMNLLIGSGRSNPEVVGADFTYQAIASESATYPIKTADEAYKELKEGKAFVSTYYGESEVIKIREIFFAYFIGEEKQDYLMPVVVFKGDDGFYAYVSAVKDEWLEN